MFPRRHTLQTIDELRVEPRCDLDAHTCWEEKEIQLSKILLLVPWNMIAFDEAGEDGVTLVSYDHSDGYPICVQLSLKIEIMNNTDDGKPIELSGSQTIPLLFSN